jgi:hypothetical protein
MLSGYSTKFLRLPAVSQSCVLQENMPVISIFHEKLCHSRSHLRCPFSTLLDWVLGFGLPQNACNRYSLSSCVEDVVSPDFRSMRISAQLGFPDLRRRADRPND